MRRLVACFMLLLMAPAVQAKRPPRYVIREAQQRFERANRLYHEGRYTEAMHLYQAAYDLLPSPDFLFNLGLAREKTFDYEGCVTAMQQYLRSPQTEQARRRAQTRLENCRARAVIPVRVSSMPPAAAILLVQGTRRTPRGRTPARLELAPGRYLVTVELTGYRPQSQEVTVKVGSRPEIDFVLERLSSLQVEADVTGAQAQIDHGPLEDVPLQRELPAGSYRVRVQKQGHKTVTREVRVEPGQQISLMLSLPRLPRVVSIAADARGTVRLDGVLVGEVPVERRLEAGRYRLYVAAPGREPFDGEISVGADRDLDLRVHLARPRPRWQTVTTWSLAGLAVGAAVAGTVFGTVSWLEHQDYTDGVPTRSLRDDGRTHARAADGLFIVAATLAVATVTFHLLTRPRSSRVAVRR